MMESIGPRPVAPGNLSATSAHAATTGTGTIDRTAVKVQPAERVHPDTPTGPRPAFEHTYLERIVSLGIEYWIGVETQYSPAKAADRPPQAASADDAAAAPDQTKDAEFARGLIDDPVQPTVDVRR